jgi:hypothetical protein
MLLELLVMFYGDDDDDDVIIMIIIITIKIRSHIEVGHAFFGGDDGTVTLRMQI